MNLNWQKLNERERKLILIMGGLVAIVFLYYLPSFMPNIFKYTFQPSISTQVQARKQQFEQLLPSINKLKILQEKKHAYTNLPASNLYEFINARMPNLDQKDDKQKPKVSEQSSGNQVVVDYPGVNFDDIIAWLENLHIQYGISVIKAQFIALDYESSPGYVDATFTLE